MEWNNKDPFFDRDLNNFRLLFELRAIHAGVIITRSWELQEIFKLLGKGTSYGKATTHHEKLWSKIEGGGGGGCPVLTFAIRPALFVDDGPVALAALEAKITAEKKSEAPINVAAARRRTTMRTATEAYSPNSEGHRVRLRSSALLWV